MKKKWQRWHPAHGCVRMNSVDIPKKEVNMAAKEFDDRNRGVLFRNNRKNTDRHPDMTGKINIEGKEYWLSGWTAYKRNDGEKYLQLSVTPIEEKAEKTKYNANDEMDDLPF